MTRRSSMTSSPVVAVSGSLTKISLTQRSPSWPWRFARASSTSAKVSIPIMWPWSITTRDPMSFCAMTLTASRTEPLGGVVNRALPLIRRISLTSISPPCLNPSTQSTPGPAQSATGAVTNLPRAGDGASLPQRLRQRPAVHVLELAAYRHAAGEPRHFEAARAEHLADVMRGRLPFIGEIRSQDDLADLPIECALEQAVEPDLLRPDAVERREPPHEDKVQATVRQGVLEHKQVGRRLDHAQQRSVALGRPT